MCLICTHRTYFVVVSPSNDYKSVKVGFPSTRALIKPTLTLNALVELTLTFRRTSRIYFNIQMCVVKPTLVFR